MSRPLFHACLASILAQGALVAQAADRCPAGLDARGDIGVRSVSCVGPAASCTINLPDADGVPVHRFSLEPAVIELSGQLTDDGPRVGDVLVAVDSLLITTERGGRRLATIRPEHPVRLLVRRDGRLRELGFTARTGCGIVSLQVRRP